MLLSEFLLVVLDRRRNKELRGWPEINIQAKPIRNRAGSCGRSNTLYGVPYESFGAQKDISMG